MRRFKANGLCSTLTLLAIAKLPPLGIARGRVRASKMMGCYALRARAEEQRGQQGTGDSLHALIPAKNWPGVKSLDGALTLS